MSFYIAIGERKRNEKTFNALFGERKRRMRFIYLVLLCLCLIVNFNALFGHFISYRKNDFDVLSNSFMFFVAEIYSAAQ